MRPTAENSGVDPKLEDWVKKGAWYKYEGKV